MKAIGQAQGALAALAALLPDDAERVTDDGASSACRSPTCGVGDVVLVRPGARVPADGAHRRRRGRARRVDDHRRVPAGAARPSATGWSPARWPPTRRSGSGSTRSARTPRWPASSAWSRRRRQSSGRAQVLADRFAAMLFYIATARRAGHLRRLVGARRPGPGGGPDRHRAGDRLPARPRPGHPAGDRAVHRASSARAGILVKDRLALERMRTVDAVLFDKTGTLTKGAHTVTGVAAADGLTEDEVLRLAGARRGRQRAPAGPGHRRGRRPARRHAPRRPTSGR